MGSAKEMVGRFVLDICRAIFVKTLREYILAMHK